MTFSSLSSRATAAIKAGSETILWEIFKNLYDPETNPTGFYSLGVAENLLMHEELLNHIHKHINLSSKTLTYNDGGSGSKRLKAAMARFLNHQLHPVIPLEPQHLILTNGVSVAVENMAWALTNPGEGVLLGRPYYATFIEDLSLRFGAEVVPVDFGDVDPLGRECVAAYRRAKKAFELRTGKPVRVLLLCHPHNPLGRCYPRSVIVELMRFCQESQIHLISDEVYALSMWGEGVFESALSIDTTGIIDPERVHVLWGMSKDFGANGIRLGAVISQANPDLRTALDSVGLYGYVAGPSDHLTANVLEDDDFTSEYIRLNNMRLKETYTHTIEFLTKHHIPYLSCHAGIFIWVDLGTPYLDRHPETRIEELSARVMQKLLDKKVFLASGAVFGSEKPGWFRIVFAHPRPYLDEALRRIVAAIE